MALKTYNPAEVTIVFAGIPISGYAEGTFVSIERNEDSFALQVGADSNATRAKSNNFSGRVTLTLIQSSASNDALSAQLSLDEQDDGAGIGSLLIKDLSGRTVVEAEQAWLTKPATTEFGREASEREWVIETDKLIMGVAGN